MPATPAHSIVPAGTGLLDIAAAAQLLNIPEGALRKSVSARRVPHTRLGKHVRFAPHHIEAIVAAGEQEIVAPPRTTSATGRSRL